MDATLFLGQLFNGFSVASLFVLAALGLALSFGLMRVINMAHGEMLMIGAYATYVTQLFFRTHLPAHESAYLFAEHYSHELAQALATVDVAAFALSGVIRQRNNGTLIFAQFVRASDRGHLWAFRMVDSTGRLDPLPIAERIADSVSAILLHPERRRVPGGFER